MNAERRQLTILNCDIFGSSVYADSLDPEDFASLLSVFFSTCNKVVGSCGGTMAQNSGDGILAYFGYPKTHGQDARDAIECGKLIVDALTRESMSRTDNLQVRIGITTGLVVLTDVQVQHGKSDRIAIGSAAHRSERIQKLAAGGEVLVDEASRKLSERYYEFVDLGMHKLKGFTRPSQVWGVGDPRPVMFRFEERGPSLAPIFGRNSELELLSVLWSQAREGKGWAAYISGEPGIGKSRLAFEFARQSAPHVAPLVLQCIRDHENAPLHPWLSYISQVAGVGPVDSMAVRRKKVDAVLGTAYPEHDWLPSFVLQLLTQGGSKQEQEDDEMLPPRRLGALQEAIVTGLLSWCSRSPQILIVEDVHWIDPTSKALLELLLASISAARILVLVTGRQEASHSVSGSHTTRLELGKLTASQSRELVTTILGSTAAEETVVERLVSRSDGIPLYVEEMARAMSEGELDLVGHQDSGEPADDGVAADVTIPDALQGTLYARLDALGDRKWVAQVASVIGRLFELRVLASLSGRSAETLGDDIGALLDSGLVESVRSGATYLFGFKHALVRDAAYSSLLHRDAQKLHGELALLYEREYPEMQQTQPDVVVRHLSQAGRWLDAANVWLKAGEFATEVGSTTEAMTRLNQCLECLNQVPSSTEVDEIRMRGQLALGSVINTHFGPADPKTLQALDVAAELAESLNDTEALVECLALLGKVKYNAGDFPGAGLVAARMVEIGEQHEFLSASVKGLTNSGLCLFAMGQFKKARAELERAHRLVEHADPETRRFECLVLVYRALTMHILGEPGIAIELCDTALERAKSRSTNDLLSTLGNSLYLYWMQSNLELTRETAQELSKVAEKTGHLMWYHQAAFFLGWVRAVDGDATGLAMMEASMTRFRDAGELVEQSMFYGIMAEQYLTHERHTMAVQAVDHGLELVDRLSERFFEVPLLQLKARCLHNQVTEADDPDQIATVLARASRVAEEQGAVAWTQTDRDGSSI